MKNFSFIIFIVLLGCTNPNDINYNQVKKVQKTTSIPKLVDNNLTENELLIISLGKDYKETILDNNHTVFACKFNISNLTQPSSITIKSSTFKGFFAPKLIFLDKEYNIIKTVLAKELRFDRGYFKGTIFIGEEMKKLSYLIVTQDLNEINKKYTNSQVTSSVINTGYFYYVYASGDIKSTLTNANGGEIKLTLKEYKPKILGAVDTDEDP